MVEVWALWDGSDFELAVGAVAAAGTQCSRIVLGSCGPRLSRSRCARLWGDDFWIIVILLDFIVP